MDPAARVQELVETVLASQGLELVDVEYKGSVLRLSVDRPGGVDLDAISVATQHVSDLLDEHDPVPGRYTLEVSSPGLERPLRTPQHFRRFVGSVITVKTRPEVPGERRLQGVLESADDDGITVAGRPLSYGEIERARTVFEWGPAPKKQAASPRSKRSPRKKAATE